MSSSNRSEKRSGSTSKASPVSPGSASSSSFDPSLSMSRPMPDMMVTSTRPAAYCVSPDPALQFVFAMFALMTWLSTLIDMTPDASFVMGILQISLGIAAFTGSRMNLRRHDPHGNINLILSVILGFASGLTTMARVITHITMPHAMFHPWILSVILIAGGLYMLCFLPLLGQMPAYIWCEHLAVCAGFLCNGLSDLLGLPPLKIIGAWLLFVFAILALYQGISQMYALHGREVFQGPKMRFKIPGKPAE